jgi:hypothetical protein
MTDWAMKALSTKAGMWRAVLLACALSFVVVIITARLTKLLALEVPPAESWL